MLKERHLAELSRESERQFGGTLFEDVMAGAVVKAVPARLVPFTAPITRDQIRREGWFLFLVWLLGEEYGVTVKIPPGRGTPCASLDDAIWFPAWPDSADTSTDDYEDQELAAELDSAQAKRMCVACDVRQLCLAQAQAVGVQYVEREPEGYGIFGGWGGSARHAISEDYLRRRRAYTRGCRELKMGQTAHPRWSMSTTEVERSRAAARRLARLLASDLHGSVEPGFPRFDADGASD